MGKTMLHGVLNMPPDFWADTEADKMQRHGRYMEASRRIEDLERALIALDWAVYWEESVPDREAELITRLLREAEEERQTNDEG